MKRLFLILVLFLTNSAFSQDAVLNDYVVSPPGRDVVYIIDNSIGRMIYDSWETDPEFNGIKPKVVLVTDLTPYRKKVEKQVKKSKK